MTDKEIFLHFLERIYAFPVVKAATGIFLWLVRLLYGPVFRPAYATVLLLWLTDTATGFYYARANPEVKPESRRMYHGLVKLVRYYILLFLGYQCSRAEATVFVQTVIESFILLTETYSVLENLQRICKLKGIRAPILNWVMRVIQGRIDGVAGENETSRTKNGVQ